MGTFTYKTQLGPAVEAFQFHPEEDDSRLTRPYPAWLLHLLAANMIRKKPTTDQWYLIGVMPIPLGEDDWLVNTKPEVNLGKVSYIEPEFVTRHVQVMSDSNFKMFFTKD